MHHRSVDVAAKVTAQIDLRRARTLLDLGGGPGTYAMAFLARHSKLKATICDRAAALEVAKEIAATQRVRRRLSYLALNFIDNRSREITMWCSTPTCFISIHPKKTGRCSGKSFPLYLPVDG